MVNAQLGVAPYDVLVTGLTEVTGLPFGVISILLASVWIGIGCLLGVRPGVGTVVLTLAVGPLFDLGFAIAPEPDALLLRAPMFLGGAVITGLAVALLISARLGSPGFEMAMLGLSSRGLSLRWVRTGLEFLAFSIGWALGGQVGIGTVVFALAFGHLLHGWLTVLGESTTPDEVEDAAASV